MRHRVLGGLAAIGIALASIVHTLPARAVEQRVTLQVQAHGAEATRGTALPLEISAQVAPGWHINAHQPKQAYLIATELTLKPPDGVPFDPVQYPAPEKHKFAFSGDEELLVYQGMLVLPTALRVPAAYAGDELPIEATLRYQACNDSTCLPPTTAKAETVVHVRGVTVGKPDGGGAGVSRAPGNDEGAGRFERWLTESGLAFTLLAVALLGLGLNLTPCVYPLISVTIAYFGRQSRSRGHVILLALLYVLGIAVSFSALGVAAALSGGIFGQAMQRPIVVLSIAALLVALALSSFGLYQFQPPAALMQRAGGAAQGGLGALFMGLTMGIVAAPCVGPIVVGLLVFVGSRQDATLGFLLFFALALGMGLPYVGLALAAKSIRHLPRSGEWLLWTERLFGCVLLSMAVYFVTPLLPSAWGFLALPAAVAASGLYLGFFTGAGGALRYFPLVKRAVGVAMVSIGLWLAQPVAEQSIGWEAIRALADDSPKAEDSRSAKPLLIDFAAEWCIPCREMDHSTYVQPDVVQEAARFRMVKADMTEENDQTAALSRRYDVRGVPTVILYSSTGAEKRRFVGYVSAQEMLGAMRAVR